MSVRRNAAWYRANDPLRAAVEYLSASSPAFNWVGVYLLRGDSLELGPYIGAATEHTHIKVGVGVCGTAVARNADMNVPDVATLDNYLACSIDTRRPDSRFGWLHCRADRHRQPHAGRVRCARGAARQGSCRRARCTLGRRGELHGDTRELITRNEFRRADQQDAAVP